MPTCTLATGLNIHKKRKYLKKKEVSHGETRRTRRTAQEVRELAETLRSDSPVGRALRTLIRRVRHPHMPVSKEDLEQLLLLSLAEHANEERE